MTPFEQELRKVTELISLPEVYLKINRLMDDPASDINDFARVIRLDSNLSAKLLGAVNSVFYGFAGEISSISRAVQLVGIQQLHLMALSVSAITAVASLKFPADLVDFKAFWRASLLSGTLSRSLAQELGLPSAERFFILGLLHEIGHLVLYAHFPDRAREVQQRARLEGMTTNQAEMEILGLHYGQIGAQLMAQWNLPQNLQDLTRLQPTPEQAGEYRREAALLNIAHGQAHRYYLETDAEIEDLVNPFAWEATGLSNDILSEHMEAALASSLELESILLKPH